LSWESGKQLLFILPNQAEAYFYYSESKTSCSNAARLRSLGQVEQKGWTV